MKSKWMFLPLAFAVLISYVFQRGLVVFSKTSLVPPELLTGLTYYFICGGLAAAFIGILCDKVNVRKLLLISYILGFVGLLVLKMSPLVFGLLFGISAATARLGPFSAPMKVIDKGASLSIVPQSMAKSLSTPLFVFLLAGLLKGLGWDWSVCILSALFLGIGVWVYSQVPNDYTEGWKLKEIPRWFMNWEILAFMACQVGQTMAYQTILKNMLPTLQGVGYTAVFATTLVSASFLLEFTGRLPVAWFADKFGYGRVYWVSALLVPVYILVPTFPVVALALTMIFSSVSTPTMFPYGRRLVGKASVGTLLGVSLVIQYLATGIFWGFVK